MSKKDFFIPQVDDEPNKTGIDSVTIPPRKQQKYESEGFISSLYGRNVKDDDYVPNSEKEKGDTRRYETLKSDRKDYNEFNQYIFNKNPYFNANQNKKEEKVSEVIAETKEEVVNEVNYYERNNDIIYQETVITEEEVEEDLYYNETVEKDEYVSVKQNINNYTIPESKNNDYQPERIQVVEESKPTISPKPVQKQGDYKQELKPKPRSKYIAPPLEILNIKQESDDNNETDILKQRDTIDLTLKNFDIGGHVVHYTKGPTVTQFEVQLDSGVRNQKIGSIQSNIQGNLLATSIRMQIPIPGKATIGIEVPNTNREMVYFGDMISEPKFLNDGNPLNVVLGVNISGKPVYLDIPKMPHGLIAGSTGSGKSVCINAIIATILYKAHPDDVKLILIDPKRVEFARYAGIPHLASPIITEPKLANAALKWVVDEMEARYRLFETTGVTKYTEYLEEAKDDARLKHIPYLVIIIDELADLMMTSGPEVEESIMRITQKARAAGIHLIVATQRPSTDIISGSIKTNIPTRIAFRVNKTIDSTIIIDHPGAEKLLGYGDMLYTDDMGVENRIQGAYISGSEIKRIVNMLDESCTSEFLFTEEDLKKKTTVDHSNDAFEDELFEDIARYVVENNVASINLLQKKFSCGFTRIQTIIIKLGELGVVSENLGSRAREVLVNMAELEEILKSI